MLEFDPATIAKIEALRARRALGESIQVFELVECQWPAPDGSIYYAVMQTDEIADPAPPVSPVEARLIPDGRPNWFLPVQLDSSIGDEEVELTFFDADEEISTLLNEHGEGVKALFYYWFPQEELLLEMWHGHLEYGEEEDIERIVVKAVQGFRSADANCPSRGHYEHCSAVFGGLLSTQAEINQHDCPYNKHIGGAIGTNDPATGQPWTFCDRRGTSSCVARGVDPLFHLSHKTITANLQNNQTQGPNLLSTSQGNETNLDEPVPVIMGTRRKWGMPVGAFLRANNNNHPDQGFYHAIYMGPEGPIQSFSQVKIKVGDRPEQPAAAQHYNFRLGNKGQSAVSALTPHGYSGTSLIYYVFGPVNPSLVEVENANAGALIAGLNNIRVFTDATTYTEIYTTNRAWHLARILCDKRWGYGLDYERLNIESFIAAAAWCAENVRFTDPDGNTWDHVRSESHVELKGRKVQQQIEDLCMAGRLSRPFLFNGQIHVVPLRELTAPELAACPVFTDEGDSPNIIRRDGKSTLRIGKRKSVRDLINRVEGNFDDATREYLQQPLRPVEDVAAQLQAGRLTGDFSRKINKKEYPLLGVVKEAQGIKMQWSLLDLGPFDEGGLANNLPIVLEIWFADALDLHQEKVIKVLSSRLTKYGFTYFRVKKILRQDDLHYELECQAYNEAYMATFEEVYTPVPPMTCPLGQHWDPVLGMCVDNEPTEICPMGYQWNPQTGQCEPIILFRPERRVISEVEFTDGVLRIATAAP